MKSESQLRGELGEAYASRSRMEESVEDEKKLGWINGYIDALEEVLGIGNWHIRDGGLVR